MGARVGPKNLGAKESGLQNQEVTPDARRRARSGWGRALQLAALVVLASTGTQHAAQVPQKGLIPQLDHRAVDLLQRFQVDALRERHSNWDDVDFGPLQEELDRYRPLAGNRESTVRFPLVPAPSIQHDSNQTVYWTKLRALLKLFSTWPLELQSVYQKRYEVKAQSSFRRALKTRSIEGLLECYARYPLTQAGIRAGLTARTLLVEGGEFGLARRLESSIASLSPDFTPSRFAGGPTLESSQSPAPRIPRGLLRERWVRKPIAQRKRHGRDGLAPYKTRPVVPTEFEAFVSTAIGLSCYELELREEALPTLADSAEYSEVSPNLTKAPLATGSIVLDTFVTYASPAAGSGRGPNVQVVSLPRRSIYAFKRNAADSSLELLWRTDQAESQILRELSFNGFLTSTHDTIYAVGWSYSGSASSFLVALDLESGKLRWVTLIAGEQVDLTRFGYPACEPFIGDLTLHEGSLYVVTHYGTVARVVAQTGEIIWLTKYGPRRPPLSMSARRRQRYPFNPHFYWSRKAPLVYRDRVLVSPQDSDRLFSFSRETGEVVDIWPVPERRLNHLVGLHKGDLIVVSGAEVVGVDPKDLKVERFRYRLKESPLFGIPQLFDGGVLFCSREQLRALYLPSRVHQFELDLTPQGFIQPPLGAEILVSSRGIAVSTVDQFYFFYSREE